MTIAPPFVPPEAGHATDDALADLIERDARALIAGGIEVKLGRYLDSIPGLESKPIAIDAAIEFVLRSAASSGQSEESAAMTMVREFPSLSMAVHRAILLNGQCGATATTGDAKQSKPPALALPTELGPRLPDGRLRYELRQLIGDGAHGSVYLAYDRLLSESDRLATVAIKRHGSSAGPKLGDDEATRARRISHGNVVSVYDRGISPDGWPFVVMEFVDGGSLQAPAQVERLRAKPLQCAALLAQVSRGVHAAHLAGLVHCDLKPANILIGRDGVPKATDFGASSHLAIGTEPTGGPVGSWGFGAPELLRGEAGSRAIPADVYGLAAVLFGLLTGAMPNGESIADARAWSASDLGNVHERRARLLAGLPADLRAVILRSLSWDPARRHGSAESFAEDLESFLNHRPIEWSRPSVGRRALLLARRRPVAVGLSALVVLVALAATGAIARVSADGKTRVLQEQLAAAERIKGEQDRRLAQEANSRKTLQGFVDVSLRTFTPMIKRELTESAWSPTLAIMESVLGSNLLPDGQRPQEREWNSERLSIARQTLADLAAHGQGEGLEALLWRDAIAFWALRSSDNALAAQMLDEGDPVAARLVVREDRWAVVRASLRAVADARGVTTADTEQLPKVRTALENQLHALDQFQRAGGLKRLIQTELDRVSGNSSSEASTKPDSSASPAATPHDAP